MKYSSAMLVALALLPHMAWGSDAGKPDPADPAAQVPRFNYESEFHGYMRDAELPLADWRATGFHAQAPRMRDLDPQGVQQTPALAPHAQHAHPRSSDNASSARGMHHMHKM